MADYLTVDTTETLRWFTVVSRASGDPIEAGTVYYYLAARSGANSGKWWRDSDQTWQASPVGNEMRHLDDGHWTIVLSAAPFASGVRYIEYVKESNNLHIPNGRPLRGGKAADESSVQDVLTAVEAIELSPNNVVFNLSESSS